jgi:hypothetical protein
MDRLQRVQNTAARIATRTKRSDHRKPVLKNPASLASCSTPHNFQDPPFNL